MILGWTVRPEESSEVCRRGLRLLGQADSPVRIFLMYVMAGQAALANDLNAALPVLDEVQQLAVPPHPAVMKTVSQLQTYLRFSCAQLELAYETAGETQRLCDSAGDLWGQVDVAWIRGAMAFQLGRLDEGVSIARNAIPLSERIGHWGNAFFCHDLLHQGRYAAGDLECATEAAAVLDEYERLHYAPWGVKSIVSLVNVARARGRIDEAVEWCRRVNLPERNHWGGYPHAALALTFAQAGDPRASQALADALRYVPRAGHPAPYGRWPTLNLVIEALATAGRAENAAALHAGAEEMLGLGSQSCGRVRRSRAEEHHQIAIRQADAWSLRICQPIARHWYAEMQRARGELSDPYRARALLSEAFSTFESLGMPLYARQAAEKLRALSMARADCKVRS